MLLNLLVAVAEEEAHAGPASPFEVNFGLVFWTWLVFIALMIVLKKYAFPAILKATEEREQTIARYLGQAEKANAEAKSLLDENRRLLGEARAQAQAMLAEAKSAGEKERAAAVEKTRHEQEDLLARARREIVAEKDKAITDLRREAVDISLAAASKLIGQRLDGASDRALVEQYLTTMGQGK